MDSWWCFSAKLLGDAESSSGFSVLTPGRRITDAVKQRFLPWSPKGEDLMVVPAAV
jgi:hypothetical protein